MTLKKLLLIAQKKNPDIEEVIKYKSSKELYNTNTRVRRFVKNKIYSLDGTDIDKRFYGDSFSDFKMYLFYRCGFWTDVEPIYVLFFKDGSFSLARLDDFK